MNQNLETLYGEMNDITYKLFDFISSKTLIEELKELYIYAIGSEETDGWDNQKRSNIAYTLFQLEACLINLEESNQKVIKYKKQLISMTH